MRPPACGPGVGPHPVTGNQFACGPRVWAGRLSVVQLSRAHDSELRRHFALCALSRNKTAPDCSRVAGQAGVQSGLPRPCRPGKSIWSSADEVLARHDEDFAVLLQRGCFGASKKQGMSVRMPLSSCRPTHLCAGACYAHDAVDAQSAAVVRGVVNGMIAERIEHGPRATRGRFWRACTPRHSGPLGWPSGRSRGWALGGPDAPTSGSPMSARLRPFRSLAMPWLVRSATCRAARVS
jgi:hypothetical protein